MVQATDTASGEITGITRTPRSARADVLNPVLRLPAVQQIIGLPIEQRRPLGILLRQLADQANEEAERSRKKSKHMMFAYWKVAAVYIRHTARAIDPINRRAASPVTTKAA